MFPYWLLFSLFAAGSLQHRRSGSVWSRSSPLLAAAGLLTALMIGFRYQVGGDWDNYQQILWSVRHLELAEVLKQSDPAYGLLNWLATILGLRIWFVNLVCGLIFSWGLVKFARCQRNPWLALVVAAPYLITVVAMGYSRQGVAIGLVMAGLAAFERGSMVRLCFYVLMATAFHKSAVIVLPLVALAATRQRLVTATVLLLTTGLLYYLFVQDSVDALMTNYVQAKYSSEGAATRIGMNVLPALIFLFFQHRFSMTEQQRKLWRVFALSALVAFVLLFISSSSTAVDRASLLLIPLQMVVLSRLPEAFADRGRPNGQLALLVIGYSALIQFVWLNYAAHAHGWLPYRVYPIFSE